MTMKTESAKVRLPVNFSKAKAALAACWDLDEVLQWRKTAEAARAYAAMANDDTLKNDAVRIQLRATRRMGELYKLLDARGGKRSKGNTSVPSEKIGRVELATSQGVSVRDRKDSHVIQAMPEADFEAAVNRPTPPSVPQLASEVRRLTFSPPGIADKPAVVITGPAKAEARGKPLTGADMATVPFMTWNKVSRALHDLVDLDEELKGTHIPLDRVAEKFWELDGAERDGCIKAMKMAGRLYNAILESRPRPKQVGSDGGTTH